MFTYPRAGLILWGLTSLPNQSFPLREVEAVSGPARGQAPVASRPLTTHPASAKRGAPRRVAEQRSKHRPSSPGAPSRCRRASYSVLPLNVVSGAAVRIVNVKDIGSAHVTRFGSKKRFTCDNCHKELGTNSTHLKEHTLSGSCNANKYIKEVILQKLQEGRHEHASSAGFTQQGKECP